MTSSPCVLGSMLFPFQSTRVPASWTARSRPASSRMVIANWGTATSVSCIPELMTAKSGRRGPQCCAPGSCSRHASSVWNLRRECGGIQAATVRSLPCTGHTRGSSEPDALWAREGPDAQEVPGELEVAREAVVDEDVMGRSSYGHVAVVAVEINLLTASLMGHSSASYCWCLKLSCQKTQIPYLDSMWVFLALEGYPEFCVGPILPASTEVLLLICGEHGSTMQN